MKRALSKLSKPSIIMTLIFITLMIVACLHVAIKYAYTDELAHYHTGTCYILACTSTLHLCCSTSRGITTCSNCYSINITFDMYVSNTTNYTKTDQTINTDSDYCDNHVVPCYYDDRNVFNSLRVFYQYRAMGGIVGIISLSLSLLISLTILLTISCNYLFCVKSVEIV